MTRIPPITTSDLVGPLGEAAQEYLDRQSHRNRPAGRWDRARRFHLAEPCTCKPVRAPSRAHPLSEWRHGGTARHIASMYAVDRRRLLQAARMIGG